MLSDELERETLESAFDIAKSEALNEAQKKVINLLFKQYNA